jgi:hypothetical protein
MADKETPQEAEKEVVKTADRLAALDTPTEETEETKVETKSEQPKETETAEKPDKTPEEEVEVSVPSDPKEAGRAFAEMRNKNKELEKRLSEMESQNTEVAAPPEGPFMPPVSENQSTGIQPNVDQNQFYNDDTGEFDVVGYQNAIRTETQKLASDIAKQQVDEFRQTQEAYGSYPELDPDSKEFDKEFYRATRGMLLDSMVRPDEYGGKALSFKKAADTVLGLSAKTRKQLADQGAEKAIEEVVAKETASLEAGGNSGRAALAESVEEQEHLSDQTRKGGKEGAQAIADRLDKLGI